jgi:Epoxide hydrolase N terminus
VHGDVRCRDGQNIHFLHVRSTEPYALPLILTHGWPNSVVEYLGLVGPLTDPRAHGGDPADAFDVVAAAGPGTVECLPPSAQAVLRRTRVPLLPAWLGLLPMQVQGKSIEGSSASHPAPPKSRVKKPFRFW